ncbi:MAG: phosphotransferase [Gemmatimonadetes bacterium]|nr:phosphotransferase [Gemmatimonadota bacterium]NNL29600.1 phosphotransferase [Gemmatimonadota bacterium]
MALPGSVREEVTVAIQRLDGEDGSIRAVTPVGGGCINHGVRVDTVTGRTYFLKWNAAAPSQMFAAEEDGLHALRAAAEAIDETVRPRVPLPLARSADATSTTGGAWLLTEWLPPGPDSGEADKGLGRGLALLHGIGATTPRPLPDTADGIFGWERDNWIGSLPQGNAPTDSWPDFWRDRRILPQLQLARGNGFFRGGLMDRLVDAIPKALETTEEASLLHGDLWSGNSYVTDDGRAALVDPAVYRGDSQVDLAMTELFGGFGASFYRAYDDERPITEEYRSHRRALYQLYYLLVHVNLFGASYEAGCRGAADTVLAAVG